MAKVIHMRVKAQQRRWLLLSVATWFILLPSFAAAQALTGALVGTVKDEQGAVLRYCHADRSPPD